MNDQKQIPDPTTLSARIQILTEIVDTKTFQLNTLIENLKRLDGYVLGSKESTEKVEKYIKQQKNELKELTSQGKLTKEVSTFLDSVLNSLLSFTKNVGMDAERLFFSKQGEITFLKQDIEKLAVLKKNHESAIEKQEKENQESSDEEQRVRPDKNPNTKIGKAAMDLIERKKKAKEGLEPNKENVTKKRGRKNLKQINKNL